jgi:uncharacterized membrane protein YhiD involved in acid resistance
MPAFFGLLVLLLAALVLGAGVAGNDGGAHPLGGDFGIAGLQLTGLSVGELFLYGAVVGAVAMLGLSMVLGTFSRRVARHRSRSLLRVSHRETDVLRGDRDRLSAQLEERTGLHAAQSLPAAETGSVG